MKDIATGRVHITSQNHGYAVDGDGLPAGVEVSHVHLNDGTVEGLRGTASPLLTIQYHSEAVAGPLDNMYIFERFVEMLEARVNENEADAEYELIKSSDTVPGESSYLTIRAALTELRADRSCRA